MKQIAWLFPLFFAVPIIIGLLDFYLIFITGSGFMPLCGDKEFAFRIILLFFSGLLAIISGTFAITNSE